MQNVLPETAEVRGTGMSEQCNVSCETTAIFISPPRADQIMIFSVQSVKAGQLFRVFRNTEQLISGLCSQQGAFCHGCVLKMVLIILRQRII